MIKKLGIMLAVVFVAGIASGVLLYDYAAESVKTQIEKYE